MRTVTTLLYCGECESYCTFFPIKSHLTEFTRMTRQWSIRMSSKAEDILFLKHASSIFRQPSNPVYVCGFFMMEQVRLCAVGPTEKWLGSSMNHIQGSAVRVTPSGKPSGSEFLKNCGRYHKMVLGHHRGIS